jgi:hypothetical protein
MAKMTVDLPEDLIFEIRALARLEQRTFKALVVELLSVALARDNGQDARIEQGASKQL